MQDILERQLVQSVQAPAVDGQTTQLSEDSIHYLGYTGLRQHMRDIEWRAGCRQRLVEVFRELDIQPFTLSSVIRYKRRKQFPQKLWKYGPVAGMWLGAAVLICVLGILPSVPYPGFFAGLIPFSLLGSIVFGAIWLRRRRGRFEWKPRNLRDYPRPIPEFVLRKAVQIKEKLPTAQFRVDELVFTRDEDHFWSDPFLVIEFGGEEYYLEVWDEPDFERQL